MCRRFFKAEVVWPNWIDTRQGLIAAPRIELQIRLSAGESRFAPPVPCQWDSGSQLSVLSERLARELGIELDHEPDAQLRGVTGVQVRAWLISRWVQFPGLCGWQFKLRFLVPQGSNDPLPLLGMLDTFENFEVHSHAAEYFFFLADRHLGETLPPDSTCDQPPR
jgi:hypothetical protein